MSGGRCWGVWQTSQLEQLCPTISVIYTQLGHKCNRLAGAGIGPIAASVHTIMPQSPAIFSNWALWFCCGQTWLCRCSHPHKKCHITVSLLLMEKDRSRFHLDLPFLFFLSIKQTTSHVTSSQIVVLFQPLVRFVL